MLYLAWFQVMSTCVIFTCSQTSHVTSHMTSPDACLPTFDLPLWDIGFTAYLGWLPNWDIGLTSYLGIISLRNPRTQLTERHGNLTVTLEWASYFYKDRMSSMLWSSSAPIYFSIFPYPFQSHDLMSPDQSPDPCHLTERSPDFLVTWPFLIVLTPYCLAAHRPPYMGTPIVSGLIVLSPIVLPCYCLHPHCTHSSIVHLVGTLSHGSCLSSI